MAVKDNKLSTSRTQGSGSSGGSWAAPQAALPPSPVASCYQEQSFILRVSASSKGEELRLLYFRTVGKLKAFCLPWQKPTHNLIQTGRSPGGLSSSIPLRAGWMLHSHWVASHFVQSRLETLHRQTSASWSNLFSCLMIILLLSLTCFWLKTAQYGFMTMTSCCLAADFSKEPGSITMETCFAEKRR